MANVRAVMTTQLHTYRWVDSAGTATVIRYGIWTHDATASYARSTNALVGIHDTATFPVPAGITEAILTFSTTLASFAAPATLAHSAGLGGNTTAPQIVARLA